MKSPNSLKLGTRGSPLALAQANQIAGQLQNVTIVVIETSGDRYKGKCLADAGGKGLFVKEIEEALLEKKIDFAVHSLKDLPGILPSALMVDCYPKREDFRDCFISLKYKKFQELPEGGVVGTGSPRRKIQILAKRPDLKIEPIRGNLDTRLRKLKEGKYDALILAAAGLHRLGKQEVITEYFEPTFFLPAIGQGILGIETRREDSALIEWLKKNLEDSETAIVAKAERAFLATIGGDCYTPVAAHALIEGSYRDRPRIFHHSLEITGWLSSPDGLKQVQQTQKGNLDSPEMLGKNLAEAILNAMASH